MSKSLQVSADRMAVTSCGTLYAGKRWMYTITWSAIRAYVVRGFANFFGFGVVGFGGKVPKGIKDKLLGRGHRGGGGLGCNL